MEYQLIRSSRRKTIALQVSNAQVIVRAPKFVKTAYVEKLIQSKLQWLQQKVAEQKENLVLNPTFTQQLSSENTHNKPSVYIDGLPHNIIIEFGKKNVIQNKIEQSLTVVLNPRYKSNELHSEVIITKVKSQIEGWFKERVEDYIEQHLVAFSQQMSLHASSFKVRKYKARWGSCNSRGELSFNYLLKMLPAWVIDYVIIHELCHLEHMNHSTSFWQLVAAHCPEYQSAKHWMQLHQLYLKWS
ncbi:M48 family metallopeptidase [Colwellia sp. BRX10-3]|uniref:M48 family metallopeptidase n=1 Tax=Colwellia sp. BRX10-3 TaxID=2759844 RepID=UPI0015F39A28|nr:SprT family zinc-dependent metalloprotease [Colwellia sp. BRX10-3]MBA6390195.1 M48 family metallopeptidase [Colwellia sp. BRX10-3]